MGLINIRERIPLPYLNLCCDKIWAYQQMGVIILTKTKKIVGIAIAAGLVIAAGVFAVQAQQKPSQEVDVRQREYLVEKGDITVGIDGGGKLFTNSRGYKIPKDIQVNAVRFKEGDRVKKGDILFTLSDSQAEKFKETAEKERDEIKERLEELNDEKQEMLGDLNWELENRRNRTEDSYWNKRWELNNKIYNLEDELSEAVWKRDWYEDNELTRDTAARLEKELEDAKAEREKLDADRETEEQQESDPDFQRQLQEEKLRDLESKIKQVTKELESAEKRVKSAGKTEIKAASDGVVTKVNTPSGTKTGEKPVLEIGEDKAIKLKVTIEPEDIVDITDGQEAEIYVDAFPETAIKGKVERRVLTPDSNGKYGAVITIENEGMELLAGMTGSATIIVKQKKDVLTISNKAVELKDGKQYVKMRDDENGLKDVEIETGFSDGKVSEVLSGLKEGDTVIKIDESASKDAESGQTGQSGSVTMQFSGNT